MILYLRLFYKKETEVWEELETSCVLLSLERETPHRCTYNNQENYFFYTPSLRTILQNVSYYMGIIFKGFHRYHVSVSRTFINNIRHCVLFSHIVAQYCIERVYFS